VDEIVTAVRTFLLEDLLADRPPANLTETTPLITGGLLDSLATLRLVGFLEERYGVRIEAHEAGVARMNTLRDVADLVRGKQR
jgi:acyl carrier protein